MLDQTGAELYCADMQGFRGEELLIETWFPDRRPLISSETVRKEPAVYRPTLRAFVEAVQQRNLNPNTFVVSRRLIERAGGYCATLRFGEDFEFLLRMADRSNGILFCDKVVAKYRLPEGDSHSLSFKRSEECLQQLAGAQLLRVMSRSKEVRAAARRRESWTLRQLSQLLAHDGRRGAAFSFAVGGFVVRPTFGAIRDIVRVYI
jgi:hypothetical protein